MKKVLLCLLLLPLLALEPESATVSKVTGVNFVAPAKPVENDCYKALDAIDAKWIALNPYSFSEPGKAKLNHNINWQWWGEKNVGVEAMTKLAKEENLNILIKPHIWVKGQGWPGDFTLETEAEWREWERGYEEYVVGLAQIAEKYKVEMFALGTEVRQSVKQRPRFWKHLIRKVREVYSGKLTYASNWDNYREVTFWESLDYVGIDAYFPLIETPNPSLKAISAAWKPYVKELEDFSNEINKPILFTEYGYRSVDRCTWKQWEIPEHWEYKGTANHEAQQNGYEAIYQAFWDKPWFAGGFIWKWYDRDKGAGGMADTDYTPQNKPVEKIIQKWYSED